MLATFWVHLSIFAQDRRGNPAIEYALVGAIVAISAIGGLMALGGGAGGMWDETGADILNSLENR